MSVVCIVAFACKQLCSLTLRKLDHLLVYWVKVHPSSFLTSVCFCLHEADVRNRLGSLFSQTAAVPSVLTAYHGFYALSLSGSLVTHPPNRVKDK